MCVAAVERNDVAIVIDPNVNANGFGFHRMRLMTATMTMATIVHMHTNKSRCLLQSIGCSATS